MDLSGRGYLDGNTCLCDWGWYQKNCTKNSSTSSNTICSKICSANGLGCWGNETWLAFRAVFTISYLFLLLVCLIKLKVALSHDKVSGFKRLFYRLIRSPKNLCLFFLIVIGVLRVSWLSYDPFGFYNKATRLEDRLLFETVYPIIYGLYASVLLVWGGLYQGMRSTKSDPFKILRKLIMIMMILAFPASITVSTLKGNRVPTDYWVPLSYAFVIFGVFLMVLGFIIFGILLLIYIEKNVTKDNSILSDRPKYIGLTADDRKVSIDKLKTARASREEFTIAKLRQQETIKNYQEWDVFVSSSDEASDMRENFHFREDEVFPKRKKIKENNIISLITEEDRLIFRKLGILLTISIIIGLTVLIFFAISSSSKDSRTSEDDIGLLFSAFFIEIFACFSTLIVFTRQIKVRDKNYLRFFSYVSMKMNKQIPRIKYPKKFTLIGTRLHNFYS